MAFLTKEAARALRLDQKPDGENILWKLVCTPGQYILHYLEGAEEQFRGVSTARLAKAFGSHAVDSGWLPPGVCRWGRQAEGDWMVRFYPASPYTLQFGMPEHTDSFIVTVRLPAMVFAGISDTYYVWAVKDRQFSVQSPLFAVPLSNVWGDGRICYGTNNPPAVSAEAWQTIEEAWQLFIASPFIGDLATGKSQAQPQDVRLQLVKASQSAHKQYPLHDLVAYGSKGNPITIEKAVEAMVKSTRNRQGGA